MAAGDVRIGISGWRYVPWRGVFYPEGLRQRDELAYAASHFASIELNGSFYSLQHVASWLRWRDETPPGFVFAVKGPRYVTHMLKLRNVRAPVANFLASGLLALGDKLGPILWQFPPQLGFDAERFAAFFELLPRDDAAALALAHEHDARMNERSHLPPPKPGAAPRRWRHAVEVRHPTFASPEFVTLLRAHDIGLVVADTAQRWPLLEDLTTDFVYVRLHGDVELYASGYGDPALADWARRIAAWRDGRQVADARLAAPAASAPKAKARDVYVYFDNDVKAHAPRDAARLAKLLGVGPGTEHAHPPPGSGVEPRTAWPSLKASARRSSSTRRTGPRPARRRRGTASSARPDGATPRARHGRVRAGRRR